MIRALACGGLLIGASLVSASAEDKLTVEALLRQGYAIAGTVPSTAGPGLFLRKGETLILCFVAETPASTNVVTQYCKPVR